MMNYRVIAVDETHNWSPDIIAITGRIAGVYVVNFGEVTHLCSLDGYYWGEFLRNVTEHYVREPDGYRDGAPVWDDEWAAENPEAFARSVALEKARGGAFYGLAYENGGEPGRYFGERALDPARGSAIDMAGAGWTDEPPADDAGEDEREAYRRERDQAAYDAAREYENNGEEWADLAPWRPAPADEVAA